MKKIIISAADENFFPLLKDLVLSLAACDEFSSIELGILDLGFSDSNLRWLKNYTSLVTKPSCSMDIPDSISIDARILSVTERLFITDHFPGFDIYLYMDADTWVQEWTGVSHYLEVAQQNALAVTPQLNRSYIGNETTMHKWRYENFKMGYGEKIASALYLRTHMNAGIFALAANAPHWEKWRTRFQQGIEQSKGKMLIEQIALNVMLYGDRMHFCPLPASCNWVCHQAIPKWDDVSAKFVEPIFPHEPIYIMHLTGKEKLSDLRFSNTRQQE